MNLNLNLTQNQKCLIWLFRFQANFQKSFLELVSKFRDDYTDLVLDLVLNVCQHDGVHIECRRNLCQK